MVAILGILLCLIAFFLSRILSQFDGLTKEVRELNATMIKIDKDLSGDIGILKEKVKNLDEIWDRTREIEGIVNSIQAGGCSAYNKCNLNRN